jgi:hypothetical protein
MVPTSDFSGLAKLDLRFGEHGRECSYRTD